MANQGLGLYGFLNGSGVPQDSIRIRFRYTDQTAAKNFPALEFKFTMTDPQANSNPYYDVNDFMINVPVTEGAYSPDFLVPLYRRVRQAQSWYYIEIRNPATSELLYWYPDFPIFDTPLHELTGGVYLFIDFALTDFPENDPGYYNLATNILQL